MVLGSFRLRGGNDPLAAGTTLKSQILVFDANVNVIQSPERDVFFRPQELVGRMALEFAAGNS